MSGRLNKNTIGGLVVLAVGAGGAWIASGYVLGTWMRIGPGIFPLLVSIGLAVIGIGITLKGLLEDGDPLESIPWRPLVVVPGAMTLFALTLPRLGLVVSCILLVGSAAFAMRRPRALEVLLLSAVLAAFSAAVFVWGLRIPFRVWPT